MKKNTGFTLIELMIVVAIIALLASIAIPSYDKYVKKGRRSQAQQIMLDAANRNEQYILDARQYTADFTTLNIAAPEGWTCTATTCSNNFYSIATVVDNTATPPTFTITATAQGAQTDDGNLVLNSDGTKTGKW